MKEHGIAFNSQMLAALRAGQKVQTRRLKPRQIEVGDRIWVKEGLYTEWEDARYQADKEYVKPFVDGKQYNYAEWDWQRTTLPAIFMPKWACRTWLEVTAVRLEPLCGISDLDLLREGIDYEYVGEDQITQRRSQFIQLWDCLHPDMPYTSNPTVQVISFKMLEESKDVAQQ